MARVREQARRPAADVHPIRSLADLAKLVNVGKSTAGRWTNRDDWPFGRPPWPRAKVPEILRWAAEAIRDKSDVDRAAPPPAAPVARADTGGRVVEMFGDFDPVAVPAPDGLPLPVDRLPDLVIAGVERGVLAGRRELTPTEAAELVRASVEARRQLVDVAEWLPLHLTGHDRAAIARRLRSALYPVCLSLTETAADLSVEPPLTDDT